MTKFVNFNNSQGEDSSSFFSKMNFLGGSAGSFLTNTTMMYLIIAILFVCLAFYLYNYLVKPSTNTSFIPNNELNDKNSNEAELMLFYVDWCPHCKTAKPVWEELQKEYENKPINGYKVMFTEINCTNESPEIESLMNKYKIEGFPTIKLLKDGQIIEYDAKPTKETLIQFLNTVL
jgi:thiol-disulfide isomerase/thioredoxin